jgi:transposase
MRCEEPVRIIDILRLWDMGFSQREIAASVKCARSTVGEVQKRSREHSLSYERARDMTNDAIKALLYPESFGRRVLKSDPDWVWIHDRLKGDRNQNLQFIWEDYRKSNPEGLSYSQFCRRYNDWKNESGKNVVMVQEREPGKELFADWMGDTLECVTDSATGKLLTAHFFVATLGDSSYPYVEAFMDEKLDKWLSAHVHALEWIGGTPRVIVPDNCKTAVHRPQYYDPVINPAYWDFACHYRVAIIPARIREPQDKAPVESGVRWLETWLLGWLQGKRWFSFDALNATIRERLRELVKRPFQKRAGSREIVFEEVDRPALRPLPQQRYEYAEYVLRRVPDNYHTEYDGFYYSIPHTLYKQMVTMRVTVSTVEIVNANRERVAFHARRYTGSRYVTNPDHMPANHRHQFAANRFNGTKYRQWAETIGENTGYVIDRMLLAQSVEEQAYRACMGVLQCARKYGSDRLESACAKARVMNSCTYTTITNILKNGLDTVQQPKTDKPTPAHENLRGAKSYM